MNETINEQRIRNEVPHLYAAWKNAHRKLTAAYDAPTELADQEQRAYDELVDFVEDHGLNYSEWDPRNT